jgi:rod shape-determining protein MreC
MAVLEIRQRTGWLFVMVVVGHLVLISAQTRTARGVPVLESVVFGIFAEIQRGATSAVGAVQHAWQDYFALQEIRRQNESLHEEVARLRIALQQERTIAGESQTLQDVLQLKRELPLATTGARVIGGGASPEFLTMTIDKGTQDGLKPDMAVIAPSGVVGRVVQPSARAAKVQLLIDANAAAGALVERSRAQGVVVGGHDGLLRLEYVPSSADIKVGDRVVTSGVEGIFPSAIDFPSSSEGRYPRGFVIGHIESFERGAGKYTSVVVRPAVDFSALETVLVVLVRPSGDAIDAALASDDTGTTGSEAR